MNTNLYHDLLIAERDRLTEELSSIAALNPMTNDWEVRMDDQDTAEADPNEEADDLERSAERTALLDALEPKYRAVIHALKKIENGTYGVCEISGEQIEEERLKINPSARTCEAHMDEESTLPPV